MKVIVVGCTHAGVTAVTEIMKQHPEAEVTVYERNDNVSFLSCGIALYLQDTVKHLEDMFYETPEHLASLGVNVKIKHDVLKIDAKKQQITVQNLESKAIFTDTYDRLVMTTGSAASVPLLQGVDSSKVLVCKNYHQAQAIKQSASTSHQVTIVGAGYSGIELAEAYANTDHQVTLLQGDSQVLSNYVDPEMSARIVASLQQHGVTVHLNTPVTAFNTSEPNAPVQIKTPQGDFTSDLVVVCTGFMPNTDLLQGQVDLDRHGAVITNDWLETSEPTIFAAGDACAAKFNPTKRPIFIPLATNAVQQGRIIARNLYGHVQRYPGTQATTALRLFAQTLATTGITLKKALAAGIDATSVTYCGPYRPTFMPQTSEVVIELVYDRVDHRILGAQFFGEYDLTQSANAISISIQNQNTIEDLAFTDMLFNPFYDQPVNYLNQVAQMAIDQEN
ncbi:FAD-dependent oxidoreductase [Loigolactobacillus zhaoyuanensis]|uniref:FAD-dependent oxidoreductase n=1 Tax=Loigolactobacillus zhaoyuanensis TaxID=2486017 RepID=A0ABW8UFE9_9LACO|nr:FAD-dependent oxidoreductase [Loigolactobacillus zhaoyuanensis]